MARHTADEAVNKGSARACAAATTALKCVHFTGFACGVGRHPNANRMAGLCRLTDSDRWADYRLAA